MTTTHHLRRRRVNLVMSVMVVAIALGACRKHSPPDPAHDVDIPTPDGVVLKGSYFSPGKAGPGILLIHQCNMDRHAWDTLTPDLVAAGFHVLTFDQRGYGDTPGKGGAADAAHANADADAAYAYLVARPSVDKQRIAAGGASCGVTYSAGLATKHPELRALALMSGWAHDNARAYLTSTPALAVFGTAVERSGSDAADIRQAVAASRHPQSSAKIISGRGHGVAMFEEDASLKPTLVTWLVSQCR
jgi:dienelactone hydrolase